MTCIVTLCLHVYVLLLSDVVTSLATLSDIFSTG